MSIDPTPRLDVTQVQDAVRKLKDATAGAEKACTAFEKVDLAKLFGAGNAVSSVVSVVALGVQLGLMLAGVPSPEEQILNQLQRLSDKVEALQRRTEQHLDVVAKDLAAQMRETAWCVPVREAVGRIAADDRGLRAIRRHLAAGELTQAELLARPFIVGATSRKELLDDLSDLQVHAREYLTALVESRSYRYTEVAVEAAALLRYAALAWHDADLIGGLRMAHGRDPGDPSPDPLPPTDGLAFLQQEDEDLYGPTYAALAADVEGVLQGMVTDAPLHMKAVSDQILRTGGPLVEEPPRGSGVVEPVVSQLSERCPWLDVVAIANAQFIRVFVDDAPAGAPREWVHWQVLRQGSQGEAVILVAVAPRREPCGDPAVEHARLLAVTAAHHVPGEALRRYAYLPDLPDLPPGVRRTGQPPARAEVEQLIGTVASRGDYTHLEGDFRAWATPRRTRGGGLWVMVAQINPYRGRSTGADASLGGMALADHVVDHAATAADRLDVWCEPQLFWLTVGVTDPWIVGGFTLR